MKSTNKLPIINRPYKVEDYHSLLAAINTVCAEGKWMEVTEFMPTENWMKTLSQSMPLGQLLMLSIFEKKVIGWCRLFPIEDNYLELGIGLLKPYRNQGIGSQLLKDSLNWFRKSKFNGVKLVTKANNLRAQQVFQKHGFVKYSDLGNKILMILEAKK